jgi:hypothetical protein
MRLLSEKSLDALGKMAVLITCVLFTCICSLQVTGHHAYQQWA